ncbi:hypothetical protein A3712_11250 [Vibrio sp. HI00D65]|nr:hypothetical protein A3712_11250 [Vibrio sp. HI00D65]
MLKILSNNRENHILKNRIDFLHSRMLKLTLDFISIRRLPFSDKYPTILTHYILDSIVPILINIVIASMLVKPEPDKRKFNLPKMVHFSISYIDLYRYIRFKHRDD